MSTRKAGSIATPSRLLLAEAIRKWWRYCFRMGLKSTRKAGTITMPSRLLLQEVTRKW
jgi:hypothetical protein